MTNSSQYNEKKCYLCVLKNFLQTDFTKPITDLLMKNLRRIMTGVVAAIALFLLLPAMPASAQDIVLTPEQRDLAIKQIRQTLPTKISEGMVWSKIYMDKAGNMVWDMEVNPAELGVTTAAIKAELNKYTDADLLNLIGEEATSVAKMFGCNVKAKLIYPDKTYKVFTIRR